MNLQHERLMALSQALRLEGIAAQWSTLAQKAANEEASFADYLEWLLHAEQTLRTERTRQTLLKLATLPVVKTLEQYDFGFASGAPRSQLQELASLAFIERSENIVLLGPSGVGKTHLAIALGRCCPNQLDLNGTFGEAHDLITKSLFISASWASRFTLSSTGRSTTVP